MSTGTLNSEIHYSIVEWDANVANFTIDSITGFIRPASPIDFETLASIQGGHGNMNVRQIHLTLRANDLGQPSLATEAPLVIYVQDINDHAPRFEYELYERTIPEDLPGGTSMIQVIVSLYIMICNHI